MSSEASSQIGFDQLGLGGVLRRYQLFVPPNQRDYFWTEKEVTKLFQDLALAVDGSRGDYFLGSIVTIPRGPNKLEVVDGQQRLTTTAIMLRCIQEYLQPAEVVMAESLTSFLSDYTDDRRDRIPKLRLNVQDNQLFLRLMSGESINRESDLTHASHERLFDAFRVARNYIKTIVGAYDKNKHGDILNNWIQFIEHRALVVLLKVPNPANAFKMFETLNDRGLRTSQSDLVKNYLFGESGEQIGETQSRWESMRGVLSTIDSDEDLTLTFMRQALICISGHLFEPEVFDRVQAIARGASQSVRFADDLESFAMDYAALFNADHEKWNSYGLRTRKAIRTLNLINVKPMRPLILSIAAKYSEKEASAAYDFLVSLSIRLMIASSPRSGSVEMPLSKAAHAIQKGVHATAADLKEAVASIVPSDTQFHEAFAVQRMSNATLARYLLRSLEQQAKAVNDPFYVVNDDQQVINLEHVLPQKPGDKWPGIDEDMIKLCVKRVGNMALMLAKANSDLKSLPYDEKRAIYADTPYETTKQIATYDGWGLEQINQRQKVLANLAVKTWPV